MLLMITGTVLNQSERFDCTRSADHTPQTNQRELQNAQYCFVKMDKSKKEMFYGMITCGGADLLLVSVLIQAGGSLSFIKGHEMKRVKNRQ